VGELEESLKGISLALDQSQVDLEAREKRLSLSREALRGAFQQFAKHADYTARPALKAMLEKSLQTLVRQSTDNLTRRISSAPSPAQYASEFMERDLTSWSQEWLDSHTTELQQFLARHRKAVSLDFERNFGGALRLHSSLSMENRTAVVPASLDATELVDAEKNAKLATYVIPAGVGLLAAWVAGPLAIVGLVGGRLIADHNVQERAAAARSVLCHDAERTAEAAASALRQRLEPAIDRYFQELASAIQSQANDRLQQAELAFESARKRSASSKEQKEEIRHSIKNDMGLLNTIRNSL
jgi:hypothetical protein